MLPKGYKFVIANDEITEEVEEYLYDGIAIPQRRSNISNPTILGKRF